MIDNRCGVRSNQHCLAEIGPRMRESGHLSSALLGSNAGLDPTPQCAMPGPHLTPTDIAQCMRDLQERDLIEYPQEEVRESCSALFLRAEAKGAGLPEIARQGGERECSRSSLRHPGPKWTTHWAE